jgi:O-antigen ligase
MTPAQPQPRRSKIRRYVTNRLGERTTLEKNRTLTGIIFTGLAIALGTFSALVSAIVGHPVVALILLGGMAVSAFMFRKPEAGILLLIALIYTNAAYIAITYHGAPSTIPLLIAMLGMVIMVRWRFAGERPQNWEIASIIIFGYGLIRSVSLLHAADFGSVKTGLINYFKDAIIVVIIVIYIRDRQTLRRAIWTMLIGAMFLGTLSVYQQLTGTFHEDYQGFAQAVKGHIAGDSEEYRISGPIGDPNYYGQIMLMVVPLALDRVWNEKSLSLRLAAGWCLAATILTIMFTFSRGTFVGMLLVLGAMFVRRPPNPIGLVVTIVLIFPLLQFMPEGYTDRMASLADSIPLLGGDARNEDNSMQSRDAVGKAAMQMFRENPLFGVGMENFEHARFEYLRHLGASYELASAHSLYLEMAAEGGLVALTAFATMIGVVMVGLWKTEKRLVQAGFTNDSNMIAALSSSLIGYLITATFLHDAYPRYLWLLYSLSLAAINVSNSELKALSANQRPFEDSEVSGEPAVINSGA